MPRPLVSQEVLGAQNAVKVLCDKNGNLIEVIQDGSGDWRLAVDALINGGGPVAITDLDYLKDSVEAVLRDDAGNRVDVINDDGTYRLAVDVPDGLVISTVPTEKWVISEVQLLNGGVGSSNMLVNGSIVPVDFFMGPGPGEVWIVEEVGIFLAGSGSGGLYDFGTGPALPNGLELFAEISGVEHQISNMKDNIDVALSFGDHLYEPPSGGLFGSSKNIAGRMRLVIPTVLVGDDGDKIIARVNDNLLSLDGLRASIRVRREV